ncbi:MAG: chromate transporter [Oscillospiraceae bacterium]|nr:chromate transporter [Oscillospiraceae bacterium]
MEEKSKLKKILILFLNTLLISSTANSGYAMVSVMERVFVNKHGLLSKEELSDCTALAQSSPGPIGVNASGLIGYHVAGLPGALAAITGCVIPPIVFMILVTVFYRFIVENSYVALFMKGMQAGAVALVLNFAIGIFKDISEKKDVFLWILAALSFLYIRFTKLPVIFLALFCAAAAVIKTLLLGKKKEEQE